MTGLSAIKAIKDNETLLTDLSKKIWNNPEVGFKEYQASQWTGEFLEKQGFTVEAGYGGIPTAIRATWGSGSPVIGFLGEYDALPGMSQKVSSSKEPVEEGAPGQGCGHNMIGVACLGAAIGMKKEMEEKSLPGTIVFYGCPAEELLIGKGFMARAGAFRELDIVFSWHGGNRNVISYGSLTALNSAKFHFHGRTAHAGADPHNGRSALDAVELMNVGANYLREHVTSDVRIHYSMTECGGAPNIVPDKAGVWYFIRALTRDGVVDTYNRLIKIAQGAAMMTETEVTVEYLGGCYETLQNKTLVELFHQTMEEVESPVWTSEEIAFAAELNRTSTLYQPMLTSGKISEGTHLHQGVAPIDHQNTYASTDVGDVQHIVPGVFFQTATSNIGSFGHVWQGTACAGHDIGMKGMLYASQVMAVAGIKAIENPDLIKAAQAEFAKKLAGKPYICPIPDDAPIPV